MNSISMRYVKKILLFILPAILLMGCGIYNFTGGNVGDAKTFQVNYFQNYATQSPGSTFEPGVDRDFSLAMSATANQTAAQNRLSMRVKVRFYNRLKEDAAFDQSFSFFYDYPADTQLSAIKSEAHEIIFERLTQDIFNASLADW